MASIILCKNCNRTASRKHYYSYEWADRSGEFDVSWTCPHCGSKESTFVSASSSDPAIPLATLRRLDAILRAVAIHGGPEVATADLDRDTLIALDRTVQSLVECALTGAPPAPVDLAAFEGSDRLVAANAPH